MSFIEIVRPGRAEGWLSDVCEEVQSRRENVAGMIAIPSQVLEAVEQQGVYGMTSGFGLDMEEGRPGCKY